MKMKRQEGEALCAKLHDEEYLSHLEEQMAAMHNLLYAIKKPCPICQELVDHYDAAPDGDIEVGVIHRDYKCPKCETLLTYKVPLFAIEGSYFWVIREEVKQ